MASLPPNSYTRRVPDQPSVNTSPPGRPAGAESGGPGTGVTPPPGFNPLPQMAFRDPPPPPPAIAPAAPVPQNPAHAVAAAQVKPQSPSIPGLPSASSEIRAKGPDAGWKPGGLGALPPLPEPPQTPATPQMSPNSPQGGGQAQGGAQGAGAAPTPPGFPQRPFVQSFTKDHLDMMPPGHSVDTPLGTVTKNPDGSTSVHMNEAGRAHHARLVSDETGKYGDHPFKNEQGAPQPPITPGGHHYNPFAGTWSDGWKSGGQ